jgi:hypothetical protein
MKTPILNYRGFVVYEKNTRSISKNSPFQIFTPFLDFSGNRIPLDHCDEETLTQCMDTIDVEIDGLSADEKEKIHDIDLPAWRKNQ